MPDWLTPETGAVGVISASGLWLMIKRALVKNAVENTNITAADGYGQVIDTLREEVRRLAETNSKLAAALNDLQAENIKLKGEISQLHEALNNMREKLGIIQLRSSDNLQTQ